MAACAPALRPGYTWLRKKVKDSVMNKGHTKLSDDVHLNSVSRRLPSNNVVHPASTEFGNDVSVDSGYTLTHIPSEYIQKTTKIEVEQR